MPNVTGGKSNDFLQKQMEMYFSDYENAFTKTLYNVTAASDTKAEYTITLNESMMQFANALRPDHCFQYVEQIIDDVEENISGGGTLQYHHWKDVLFRKDDTFDTSYWDEPEPMFIYRSVSPVGSLGHVLITISKEEGVGWSLEIRDARGNIFDKTRADIDAFQAKTFTYHSLNIAAFPKAFFDDNASMHSTLDRHSTRIGDLEVDVAALEGTVYGSDETDPETGDVTHTNGLVDDVAGLQDDMYGQNGDVPVLTAKVNEMYPRTVGDDSLLSQTYRKALKNEVDLYDMDLGLYGGTDPETQQPVEGDIVELKRRVGVNEGTLSDHEQRITANRTDINDILAYPEYNMTGITPFYCLRRGDYSITNRAYDPVFYSDFPVAAAQDVAWMHVVEHRIKEMPMRLLKDAQLKASVDRLINEANNDGITGNRVELGCCTNTYFLFADDVANWTPSASYTRKEAITLVSFIPAKWQGGAFKPALQFLVLGGHLDGGVAAGDFNGSFVLMDKSETSTPDYHWYRYGDNVNINGMALADVKIQYH